MSLNDSIIISIVITVILLYLLVSSVHLFILLISLFIITVTCVFRRGLWGHSPISSKPTATTDDENKRINLQNECVDVFLFLRSQILVLNSIDI